MTSDDALLVVAASGTVLERTADAEEFFGRAASEAVGRPAWGLFPAVVRSAVKDPWSSSGGTGAEELLVRPVLRQDGSPPGGTAVGRLE
ncbi:PAS domain-containing protein [Streptomyces sp. NBC_01361]|uniref:PAS domain-containing protein n=1 Tax=Streptomyces sp. NBC_01361 TaxID=2903838 RepID=UPI002E34F644|nr:PAS domain-containing protein [Streptomyces sp. NBC_01361]